MSCSTSTQYRMCTVHGYEGGMKVSPYVCDAHPCMNFGTNIVLAIREHMCGVREQMTSEYWSTVSHVVALDTSNSMDSDVLQLMKECADAEAARLGMVR